MATGLFTLRQVNQAIRQKAWSGTQKTNFVEYLVVAGGGGSGNGGASGGGGGAGGLLTGIYPVATGSAITVTVGGGGAGTAGNSTASGTSSVFGNISTTGGGGGGEYLTFDGKPGGSGGGGTPWVGKDFPPGGQGVSGQGNRGGKGTAQSSSATDGGGGGAGTVGLDATSGYGGNGGAGIASAINGTVTTYAGGGGGGTYANSIVAGGTGGVGGGGNGAVPNNNGTSGATNTGGGGGGGGNTGSGGSGGSGIVIVSYPDVYAAPTATTGSPTVSTSGSGSLLINTTSYVKYPNNAAFTLAGDFTIEGFFYPTNLSAGPYFWSLGDDATSAGITLYYSSGSSLLRVYTNLAAPISGPNLSNNTWYHFSLVRSGSGTNNLVLYVNGTSVGSTTNTATFNGVSGNGFAVGAEYYTGAFGPSSSFYASNIRVVKGTAIVPPAGGPTAPLTPVTNTSFLMSTVSGAYLVDSSSSSLTATVVNTSAWNQLSPFTGTGYKNRVYTWTSSGSITF